MPEGAPPPHRKLLRRWEGTRDVRFLTFSCYGRLPLLSNDGIKQLFVERLTLAKRRHSFRLLAWVLMPEHVHLLILPDATVAPILREIKRSVAEVVLRRWKELHAPVLNHVTDKRGRRHFWQAGGGYDRNVRSDAEVDRDINYIHDNPCRRGLVRRPRDYAWSSARWYEGLDCVLPCDRLT